MPGAERPPVLNCWATDLIPRSGSAPNNAGGYSHRGRVVALCPFSCVARWVAERSALENGIGGVTQIEYAPSTQFALEDAAAGKPWPDPLPFPVTVVAAVSVSDSLGHEYRTQSAITTGIMIPQRNSSAALPASSRLTWAIRARPRW